MPGNEEFGRMVWKRTLVVTDDDATLLRREGQKGGIFEPKNAGFDRSDDVHLRLLAT